MMNFKKILSLLCTCFMISGLCISAGAEETYAITINNSVSGYSYAAYQILTGDLSGDTLSNIVWGSAITEAGKNLIYERYSLAGASRTAEKAAEAIAAASKTKSDPSMEADEVGTVLKQESGTLDDSAKQPLTFSEGKYALSVAQPGWYLIVNESVPSGDNATYSDYIVQVLGNVSLSPKSSHPSSEKHVDDVNDSDAQDHSERLDSADYDIGDVIPYSLTAVLPQDYGNYLRYQIAFIDDMSKGLTYNNDAKIYYGSSDTDGTDFTLSPDSEESAWTGGKVYHGSTADLKATQSLSAGDVITLRYTCTLNSNAVIGSAGNPNRYRLQFSNNPNESGKSISTSFTPWDKNVVFTYQTVFRKVTDGKPLTGADFTLYKKTGSDWVDVTALHGQSDHPVKRVENLTIGSDTAENAQFSFIGLDAGEYRLEETVTPEGYNTIVPITFTITANHELVSDDPKLISLSGTAETGITMTPDTAQGSLTGTIENTPGSKLPKTGGIGTVLFYLAGGSFVLLSFFLTKARK